MKGRVEAILYVAGDAVELRDLARTLDIKEKELMNLLAEMESEYDFNQRGFMLKHFGTSRVAKPSEN